MHFCLITRIDASDWLLVLPSLQYSLVNAKNNSAGVSPNKVLYGFSVRDPLQILRKLPVGLFSRLRQEKASLDRVNNGIR